MNNKFLKFLTMSHIKSLKRRQSGRTSAIVEFLVKHIINSNNLKIMVVSSSIDESEDIKRRVMSFVYNYDGLDYIGTVKSNIKTKKDVTIYFYNSKTLDYNKFRGINFNEVIFDDLSFMNIDEETMNELMIRTRNEI